MPRFTVIFCFIFISFKAFSAEAVIHNHELFQQIFSDWTYAFNHQEIDKSCRLFSNAVIANYRGVPQKNYAMICDGFKKIFADPNYRYEYHFKLQQVYQTQSLAAVRVTWYLTEFKNNKKIASSEDEGLDVFQKNKNGQWQIVNYLSYPVGKK